MTKAPTTKKKAGTGVQAEMAGAQENLNQLYMAHQVHTLAQVIFQQLAASWQPHGYHVASPVPGLAPTGAAPAWNAAWPKANPIPAPAFHPAGNPALFYWYP